MTGLRHATTAGQILRAAYEGVVIAWLMALAAVGATAADAPITLVGGGPEAPRGARRSGRPVEVPDARELVAAGGAVQAAAVLADKHPTEIAAEWNVRAGTAIDRQQRDERALERFRRVLAATSQLNGGIKP